jgi:hypothetical protein
MAYIVGGPNSGQASASNTITGVLPAHQTDDLLLFCVTDTGGSNTITVTVGWSTVSGQSTSGGVRQVWFYKVATSSSEADPVATTSGSPDLMYSTHVVRDADTSTPLHLSGRTDWTSAASYSGATITTTIDDCLIIYGWCINGSPRIQTDSNDMVVLSNVYHLGGGGCQVVGYRQQYTAGVTIAVPAYFTSSNTGGNWILAIKNKSGGSLSPDCRSGVNRIRWYGDWIASESTTTWAAPNGASGIFDDAALTTLIDGLQVSRTQAPIAVEGVNNNWGVGVSIGPTESSATYTGAEMWSGACHAITSTDFTNKVFCLQSAIDSTSAARRGSKGTAVVFSDSSGNWAAYSAVPGYVGYLAANTIYSNFIAIGSATTIGSSGTIDWSDVTKIAYLTHRIGSSTTVNRTYFKNAYLLDKAVLTGGGSNKGVSATLVPVALNVYGSLVLAEKQGLGQSLIKGRIQIGDGTSKTHYIAEATSTEYPLNWLYAPASSLSGQMFWQGFDDASAAGIDVYASASDTIDFSASVLANTVRQAFSINASSSNSATYLFTGASFVNWAVTWKTGVPCTGATFKGCAEIVAKGATFTKVTIAKTSSTDAAIAFDTTGGELDSCTIDVTGTSAAYHLEVGNGGVGAFAITLTDVTFAGTPATDKVHVTNTSGTTTININGTTTLVAGDVTSDGATVSIVSSPVYQSVVVSGFTAGSRIQIYDTTNTVELFNGTASAGDTVVSGSTATWTDPTAAAGNRAIRVRIAYTSGATAKQFQELTGLTCGTTSATASITYPVTQVNDTTYNSNAIDGPAVYASSGITFTDAATDLVNCNIPGGTVSWPTIYACFVYWLSTAAGIDDDITYIDAPDTANYLLTAMKIRNTNATPLTITSGYGRDITSGLVADIIDTAGSTGNIFPSPDHVVPFATGSGVTSQDKIDIAAETLSQAATTPIYADIRKVVGVTVDGTGTDADPWGPV